MIGLFIAIVSCVYFFVEAKKRGVSQFKWGLIAFLAFMGPQILVSWIAVPIVLVAFDIPFAESRGTQIVFGLAAFAVGFWLLVRARKRLYGHRRLEPEEDMIVVKSLDIVEKEDGSYAVGDKTFKSLKDAQDFVAFAKGLRSDD